MANDFYTASGNPGQGAPGSSGVQRSEFSAIQAGFDKLPPLSSGANRAVIINAGGTALTVTSGTLALNGNLSIAGNLTTAGAFTTTGAFGTTLIQQATVSLTLPAVSGTLATLAGTETLTNKTLTSPSINGATLATSTLTAPVIN